MRVEAIRKTKTLAGVAVAVQALAIVLTLQFAVGAFRHTLMAQMWIMAFIVLIPTIWVLAFAAPIVFERVIATPFRMVGHLLATAFLVLILAVMFVLTLIPARLINRPNQVQRRPWLKPWLVRGSDATAWRHATWVPHTHTAIAGFVSGSRLMRSVSFFGARGNRFLVVVAVVLGLLATLFTFLQTSAFAPLLYPLF